MTVSFIVCYLFIEMLTEKNVINLRGIIFFISFSNNVDKIIRLLFRIISREKR